MKNFSFKISPWYGCTSYFGLSGFIDFTINILPRFNFFKAYRIPKEKGNANGFILTFGFSWLCFIDLDFTFRLAK